MSISEISSQVADLSLADKLSLIESVVASIRKEGGMPVKGGKKAKADKAEKADKADKPKRKAALGTLAWTAYVKHIKTTQPEAFEGLTKESEKLVIVKGIRAEDADGYKSFTEAWKAEHAETASVSDASEAETASVAEEESVAEEVVVPKKAAPKAKAAVTVVVRAEPKAEPKAKPAEKAKVEKAAAEKPKVEKAAAEKPAAKVVAKKPVKAVAKAAKAEVPPMPQKEIDGTPYWHDPSTNGLWEVTGETVEDGTGSWIGYYQPGNEEEPIRFTENYGDE